MRAIGYTRVSTDVQVEQGGGLETQRASIIRWAEAGGHELVGWESDEGISGSNGLDTREGLARAIWALEQGAADALVVDALDRLARDLILQETTIARLRAAGAEVVSVREPAVEGDQALRDLMRQVLGAFAQYERARIRGRMMAGARRKLEAGGYAWGAPPFGWRAQGGELRPVEAEQRVIADILRLRQGGLSLREIADQLNEGGCRRPTGGLWRSESVRRVLIRQEALQGALRGSAEVTA